MMHISKRGDTDRDDQVVVFDVTGRVVDLTSGTHASNAAPHKLKEVPRCSGSVLRLEFNLLWQVSFKLVWEGVHHTHLQRQLLLQLIHIQASSCLASAAAAAARQSTSTISTTTSLKTICETAIAVAMGISHCHFNASC
jgi:hypothetical protein